MRIKTATIINPYINESTGEMENYVLDYKENKYIVIEPNDIENKLSEEDFVNYLINKGENRFDAIEIADKLKEESKIASLLKTAEFAPQKQIEYLKTKINNLDYDLSNVHSTEKLRNIFNELDNAFNSIQNIYNIIYPNKEAAVVTYKEASLVKVSKQEDMAFDTSAFIRIWVDIAELDFEDEIENIKKMNISLENKIKLAKEFARTLALDKLYKKEVQIKEYNPIEESLDRIDWVNLLEPEIEE